MTSAMAASSKTPSSLLLPTLGLPMGKWGSGQGALLEAQHLVKGPQGPEVAGLWFFWGEGRGPSGFRVLREGRGRPGYKKAAEPSAWPKVLCGPWTETPEGAVFPEAGPSPRGMGLGGEGRYFRNRPHRPFFILLWALQGRVGASFTSPTVTRCFPIGLGPASFGF